MTNGNGDLVGWLKEKFLGAPKFQPQQPARFYAAPRQVPLPIAATTPTSQGLDASESATLVAGSSHKTGVSDDNRSSLISGR